jgi:hypothetical protein
MYHEHDPVLPLTLRFPSTDKFRYFITQPYVQVPLNEFIRDYFGTNRDVGSIEDQGWYPVLCGMTAVSVDEYTWPDQVKKGWGYERHVARFICQVYYQAERSGLPWWQRMDNEDDYAHWGYQLYELLLYLCRIWLEEHTMPCQTSDQKVPKEEAEGVVFQDVVSDDDDDDYLLDIRDLFTEEVHCAKQDLGVSHGTAGDALLRTEATESGTKRDTSSEDETSTATVSPWLLRRSRAVAARDSLREQYLAGTQPVIIEERRTDYDASVEDQHSYTSHVVSTVPTGVFSDSTKASLTRRSVIAADSSPSSKWNAQVSRTASKLEGFDGPWATCPLPWRRSGPDNW